MKEFWVYTLLRLGLFAGSFGIVLGIWLLAISGGDWSSLVRDEVDRAVFWSVIVAFIVSGVGSYYLLRQQREGFAAKVEARASRVSDRLAEQRSKEDAD